MNKDKMNSGNSKRTRNKEKPTNINVRLEADQLEEVESKEDVQILSDMVAKSLREGHFVKSECDVLKGHFQGSSRTDKLVKLAKSSNGVSEEFASQVRKLGIF